MDPISTAIVAFLTAGLKETDEGRQAMAKFKVDARGAEVGVIGDHASVSGGIHFGDKVYQMSPPKEIDPAEVEAVIKLLAQLPEDSIPDPVSLSQL